jgi:hypothetical protein
LPSSPRTLETQRNAAHDRRRRRPLPAAKIDDERFTPLPTQPFFQKACPHARSARSGPGAAGRARSAPLLSRRLLPTSVFSVQQHHSCLWFGKKNPKDFPKVQREIKRPLPHARSPYLALTLSFFYYQKSYYQKTYRYQKRGIKVEKSRGGSGEIKELGWGVEISRKVQSKLTKTNQGP